MCLGGQQSLKARLVKQILIYNKKGIKREGYTNNPKRGNGIQIARGATVAKFAFTILEDKLQ